MRRPRTQGRGQWLWRQAKRAALILAVAGVCLALAWGARLSCESNPDCPWTVLWES